MKGRYKMDLLSHGLLSLIKTRAHLKYIKIEDIASISEYYRPKVKPKEEYESLPAIEDLLLIIEVDPRRIDPKYVMINREGKLLRTQKMFINITHKDLEGLNISFDIIRWWLKKFGAKLNS